MINYKAFRETYCFGCGSQRCEGPETEWGEGCFYLKLEKVFFSYLFVKVLIFFNII